MAAQPEFYERDVLTTGEAATLLKVSRSTVSRLFDRGELKGEVNLITGERRISRHSVLEMLRQCEARRQMASPSPRRILLATGLTAFAERMRDIVDMPPRLALTHTPFGADALIACLHACPDLLVMDGSLQDVSVDGIIAALRRQEPTRQLKILCFENSPAAAPEPGVVYIPGVDRLDDTDIRGHINQALQVVAPSGAVEASGHHRGRRWDRHPVSIPARIGIYPSRAPRQRYWGNAVIKNISRGGAFLKGIEMDDGVLTASPFRMLVQTDHPPLQNWQAKCQVTRLSCNGDVSAGVQFLRLPEPSRRQLQHLCG